MHIDDTSHINQLLQYELALRARVHCTFTVPTYAKDPKTPAEDASRADRLRVQTVYLLQLGIASVLLGRGRSKSSEWSPGGNMVAMQYAGNAICWRFANAVHRAIDPVRCCLIYLPSDCTNK